MPEIYSGFVPQQPPTNIAPNFAISANSVANPSGAEFHWRYFSQSYCGNLHLASRLQELMQL